MNRYWRTYLVCLSFVVGLGYSAYAGADSPGFSIDDKASYTLFEAGQVRPLALSPNGKRLFAINTPDNRLEVFGLSKQGMRHCGAVTVGLEPVAVAARTDREVWVVNHVSDSISIVELTGECGDDDGIGYVARTLLVADEPRDIVFAGKHRDRVFITMAHRGQNAPYDPELTTPGIGRADVWVFDANKLGDAMGGEPIGILQLFADTPRALAVSTDGSRVYAAGFKSGNRTAAPHFESVLRNGGPLPLLTNHLGEPQPIVNNIVQFDGEHWVDMGGRIWDHEV